MRRSLRALALVTALLAVAYVLESLNYPRGTAAQPGSGLYPLLVGGLLLAACIGIGLETFMPSHAGPVEWPQGLARRRVLGVIVLTFGYILLLPLLGHPAIGSLLALGVLHIMGLRSWRAKGVLALVMGLGSYYLFARVLGVPLPAGPPL